MPNYIARCLTILFLLSISACDKGQKSEVIIYTSLDRNLSEPILNKFTKVTGIKVNAVYDTEANKTIGLVNRLIAEKDNPRADVFWNNEVVQTIALNKKGVLASYHSPAAKQNDAAYRDTQGAWSGLAARARVIIVNTNLMPVGSEPITLDDFIDPKWKGKSAIANPHFGSTGTHFSALNALWGDDEFRTWIRQLTANDVGLLPGNGQVRDKVVSGEYAFGLTDTDDANGAILDGKPVKMIFPGQGDNGRGLFIIPNTVSLIKGAPNSDNGKKLIDFVLSPEAERMLAARRGAQIPLQPNVTGPINIPPIEQMKQMTVDYAVASEHFHGMLAIFENEWPR